MEKQERIFLKTNDKGKMNSVPYDEGLGIQFMGKE